ncbi:cytidine deaminase [Bacteroidales bacterium OttesenSCG-928-I14]|nr:cytidine deaminase [Bacteroidales bacterium OttesenSCG-928-I14]
MKDLNISAKINICSYNELNETEKKLIDTAKQACLRAYAAYSKFKVGAAVLLANGDIFSGNNQENAAYPSGLCAERTAIFYANSRYPDQAVDTIAIVAHNGIDFTEQVITPCGACRQVILEAQNRFNHPVRLILFGKKEIYIVPKITDILPLSFGIENLNG